MQSKFFLIKVNMMLFYGKISKFQFKMNSKLAFYSIDNTPLSVVSELFNNSPKSLYLND